MQYALLGTDASAKAACESLEHNETLYGRKLNQNDVERISNACIHPERLNSLINYVSKLPKGYVFPPFLSFEHAGMIRLLHIKLVIWNGKAFVKNLPPSRKEIKGS